jgi:hypothetical protein
MAERLLAALAALLLAAGCATRPAHPDAFSFAVMGDTPYNAAEETQFEAMLAAIGREPLAFVVHVGDFKGGGACTDALYERRRAQLDASAHPLVFTPGDNDWTDCRGAKQDPLERLARLRQVFFADRFSLGRRRMELFVQQRCALESGGACECPGLPENRFWSRGGVRFATLHVVGSNDNQGFDADNDREARCREAANAAWLEHVVRASEHSETRALALFLQANPFEGRRATYRALLERVREAARRLGKPVLFVHGDTHTPRVDTPFRDSLGNVVEAITRVETHGSPFVGWLHVGVDPDDPQVFTIRPKLHGIAPHR